MTQTEIGCEIYECEFRVQGEQGDVGWGQEMS